MHGRSSSVDIPTAPASVRVQRLISTVSVLLFWFSVLAFVAWGALLFVFPFASLSNAGDRTWLSPFLHGSEALVKDSHDALFVHFARIRGALHLGQGLLGLFGSFVIDAQEERAARAGVVLALNDGFRFLWLAMGGLGIVLYTGGQLLFDQTAAQPFANVDSVSLQLVRQGLSLSVLVEGVVGLSLLIFGFQGLMQETAQVDDKKRN